MGAGPMGERAEITLDTFSLIASVSFRF